MKNHTLIALIIYLSSNSDAFLIHRQAASRNNSVKNDQEFHGTIHNSGAPLFVASRPHERKTAAQAASPAIRKKKRPKKIPLIAVVGRPNVGKSALVNRIAGTQSGGAIVADESGITRDRTYRPAEFLGERFQIVDTGGLVFEDLESDHLFAREIREQALAAMEEAAAVILVCDGQVGMSAMDEQLAEFLRKEGRKDLPISVAINKCESAKTGQLQAAEFWSLGLGEPFPVSAIHGVGTAELMEHVFDGIVEKKSADGRFGTKVKELKAAKDALKGNDEEMEFFREYNFMPNDAKERLEKAKAAFFDDDSDGDEEEINVAIIGRPNVGKSSLLNNLFGSQRAIVSNVAGTTRDSIDAIMERPAYDYIDEDGAQQHQKTTIYKFVDTAGIRRKNKVEFGPEFFMVNRALRAIRRADVVLLVLDATSGIAEQDRVLAQKIADDGRACVVLCNKWDAVMNKDSTTYDKSVKYVREELPQIRWAPILFISAQTGQRVKKIYENVDDAVKAHRRRISTSVLNEVLRDAVLWQPPPAKRSGAQAKIYYCNQVSTRPPTIVVFVNDPSLISDNYRRYLDRKFRESIDGFDASPIRWIFRGKRVRDIERGGGRKMNGNPGDGGSGKAYPFPHAN